MRIWKDFIGYVHENIITIATFMSGREDAVSESSTSARLDKRPDSATEYSRDLFNPNSFPKFLKLLLLEVVLTVEGKSFRMLILPVLSVAHEVQTHGNQ